MTSESRHYKFNESSGSSAADSMGNAGMSGLTGSFVLGKLSNGYQPNTEAVDLGYKVSDISTKYISIAFWIKRIGAYTDYDGIISASGFSWGVYLRSASLKIALSTGSNVDYSTTTLVLNQWVHVVATFNLTNNVSKLYINGKATPEVTLTDAITTGPDNMYFGATGNDLVNFRVENVVIDDLRIYADILSAEDVSFLYNNGQGTEAALDQQRRGLKTAEIRRDYPIEEGLTARTQKQEGRISNLIPQEGTTVLSRDTALI